MGKAELVIYNVDLEALLDIRKDLKILLLSAKLQNNPLLQEIERLYSKVESYIRQYRKRSVC